MEAPTRRVPGLWFLEGPSDSVLLAPNERLLVGYTDTVLGDVFFSWLDIALVLLALITMKVRGCAIWLHVADSAALEAVLLNATKAIIEVRHTMALQIFCHLLHTLVRELLALVSTQNDLECGDQRASGVVCRRVGITMLEGELFDHTPEANLLVPRHHPVTLITNQQLGVDVADHGADWLHVESNSLGLEVVQIVSDVVAENDDGEVTLEVGEVTLEAGDVTDGLYKEVGQDLTRLGEGDEPALTEAVAFDSPRCRILVREMGRLDGA